MQRFYKCLPAHQLEYDNYKLVPVRDQDKFDIRQWRNEQIKILRQKDPLSEQQQENYFKNVVDKLFEVERPDQLLFSFLEHDVLLGYGGLVHIDWESRNAEISFLNATKRSENEETFMGDWRIWLKMLKRMSRYLNLRKIYTYAYDIRPNLYKVLAESNFIEEARLRRHVSIDNELVDVLIHSYFFSELKFRTANENDMLKYLEWANDQAVRDNSFKKEKIGIEEHMQWFSGKLNNDNCRMFVVCLDNEAVGQVRFERVSEGVYEIGLSIDKAYRGEGFGNRILRESPQLLFKTEINARKVIARVKKNNIVSQRSFISAGFVPMGTKQSDAMSFYLDKV